MPVVRQFAVVGRPIPTDRIPAPQIYRMRLYAPNEVTAKSRFWYFLHKLAKMKKETGEILAVNEIFEKKKNAINNYAIWLRYNSRSGTHNMCKEYRDTTLTGAVQQMYHEMAGRHRTRERSLQIIKTAIISPDKCRRPSVKQFHDNAIKFPLAHRIPRPSSRRFKSTYLASRPSTFRN